MSRPAATPNPHIAIDRLAALRRRMADFAAQEEALLRSIALLPDGRHEGMAARVEIATGGAGLRTIVVVADALAHGAAMAWPPEADIAPLQMM